jgi:hypothetical protein
LKAPKKATKEEDEDDKAFKVRPINLSPQDTICRLTIHITLTKSIREKKNQFLCCGVA